jgi:hypothetical protein
MRRREVLKRYATAFARSRHHDSPELSNFQNHSKKLKNFRTAPISYLVGFCTVANQPTVSSNTENEVP